MLPSTCVLPAIALDENLEPAADSTASRLGGFALPQVWLRFLLAIFGLIFAFIAALFSSVFRDTGNLWGTLITASVALVLAIVVGLSTVPYLARRVAGNRIKNVVDYQVTRLGMIYSTVVLLIGIAALNTGNNLLYIIVAVMLAAILVSGIASNLVLQNLEMSLRMPEYVFAGEPVLGRLAVRNRRRWPPSLSINVAPFNKDKASLRWQWMRASFIFPPGRPPHRRWITLPDRKLRRVKSASVAKNAFSGSAYFPYIPARDELSAVLDACFARRGRYQHEGFALSSRFPFAFLMKTRQVPLKSEVIVYPSVTVRDEQIEILPRILGAFETFKQGRGSDLYRLREYESEDSARYVDWKATARTGSLKVREFTREDNRKLRIIFDNPAPGQLTDEQYEEAVSTVASLAWYFAGKYSSVAFLAPEYDGDPGIHRFLSYLASVQPCLMPSLLPAIEPSEDFNVIVTASRQEEVPAALSQCSFVVFAGGR